MEYLRTIDANQSLVGAASRTTQQALDIGQILSSDVTLATVFPNTTLGNQLKQVAKVIKFNATSPALGLNRQIFFCQLGGFDTHQNQVTRRRNLLTQVSQAIKAFYDATVELGMDRQVTTFTLSDFGRTLQPAGPARASSAPITRGAITTSSSAAPSAAATSMASPDRTARCSRCCNWAGRATPTIADAGSRRPRSSSTRPRWRRGSASAASDFPLVFPNIGRFSTSTLGFMA